LGTGAFSAPAVSVQLLDERGQHALHLDGAMFVHFPRVFAARWQTRYFIIGRKKTAQSPSKIEVTYHRADNAIQKLIRVLAA
jgi:hypothetical protein